MASFGLIGAGNISETHARAILAVPGVELAAVWGPRLERATALTTKYGGMPYSDLDAFLRHRPMDMVAIGSPSSLHAEHGIAAARHGLHVLVEKPLDVTTARSNDLVEAAAAAGVTLGVFFQDRLAPDLAKLKTLIDAGELGKPVLASARVKWYRSPEYYSQSRWRGLRSLDGGGALMNQAIHTVDLLLWLCGPVARLSATTATRLHQIETEDTAVAILEFQSGALGVIEATTSVFPGFPRRVEITGAAGTIVVEANRVISADVHGGKDLGFGTAALDTSPSATSPAVTDIEGHRRLVADFVEAVTIGRAPVCDGREGRRSVALIEAIYEAARTGQQQIIE